MVMHSIPTKAPSLLFTCESVTMSFFENAKKHCPKSPYKSCDRVIIPFAKTSLTYVVNGNRVSLDLLPGECFYVPSQCEDSEIFSLSSNEYLIMDIDEAVRHDLIIDAEQRKDKFFSRISILHNAQHLLKFANTARRILLSSIETSVTTLKAFGVMATAEILASFHNRKKTCVHLSNKMISKIDDFIHENIGEPIKLKDLADICRMSTPHFSRSFKSAIGKSPYKFILDRRVALARRLLRETSRSIADIAYEAGFSSQSHMTEIFRKIVGTTPAKFRKAS